MNTKLRKRFEEEELTIRTDIVNEIPHVWLSTAIDKATRRGIELGYKEAIAQAKEWLNNHWDISDYNSIDEFVSDFEADMKKLWEG